MKQWMGEPELKIEIETSWEIGTPIVIRGFHHIKFETKGLVFAFDRNKRLVYSHLSSVSRLPDTESSYSLLEFLLTPDRDQTRLTLNIENFPTDTIRRHLEFYWQSTLVYIKDAVEKQTSGI
jgi:hypothetical protein